MLLLLTTALAGTVHFSTRGEMVWRDGPDAVVLDMWSKRIVAGGAWSDLEAEYGPPAPRDDTPCLSQTPAKARVLAERDGYCVVRQDSTVKLFWHGMRMWRADIPSWWGDRHTQVVFDSTMVVLYDGKTAMHVPKDGDVKLYAISAGHGPIALHADKVAFSGRPDIVLDTWRQQIVPLGELEVTDVRWRGGTVVGGNRGHAVVWDEDGRVRFVVDAPDYGERRLSPDGRELGLVFIGEDKRIGRILGTRDGGSLGEWDVCADGNRIWPIGDGRIVDLCGREVWLRGPRGEQKLATLPGTGQVSHVTVAESGVRLVAGEGSHGVQVWQVPLAGGKAVRESWDAVVGKDGTRKVQGYEAGTPRELEVEDLHGEPVEVATARAFRKMERAAKDDGVTLGVVSGFRTFAEQQVLYDCYLSGDCNDGNLAAPPGFSNHQSGLALDLNTHVPAVRKWLRSRGREFGFAATVRSEPWHWEYVGGERNPALAAALLPLAEPLFQKPRTPWTPMAVEMAEVEPEPDPAPGGDGIAESPWDSVF
ncbi:MAG: D-alanyl-D-alanine carboxypeptidase family protein [Alphaproteobacteria bacterium]|nr:D-alanyl-D-alanine carboxypeptidase family protein [Alphaproteobacteria bacterium]